MSSEMRECPFCGNGAWVVRVPDTRRFRPQCKKCGADLGEFDREADAVAAWNRRALLARTEAGAVNEGVHVDSDCSLGLDPNRKTEAGYAAPWADGAVAQVLQVYKAEDEEEEAWFGHVEFTEPLKIGGLLYTHPKDASAGDACFVALQEILAAHANDNVRPRAFYIAADALAALQQKGSGNG